MHAWCTHPQKSDQHKKNQKLIMTSTTIWPLDKQLHSHLQWKCVCVCVYIYRNISSVR